MNVGFSKEETKLENIAKIEITVSGPCGCGKTAVMAEIFQMLTAKGLAAIYSDAAHRNNPPSDIDASAAHERPSRSECVFVLSENTNSRSVVCKLNQ